MLWWEPNHRRVTAFCILPRRNPTQKRETSAIPVIAVSGSRINFGSDAQERCQEPSVTVESVRDSSLLSLSSRHSFEETVANCARHVHH